MTLVGTLVVMIGENVCDNDDDDVNEQCALII